MRYDLLSRRAFDLALSCALTWVGLMAIEAIKPRLAITALPIHFFLLAAVVFWLIHVYTKKV